MPNFFQPLSKLLGFLFAGNSFFNRLNVILCMARESPQGKPRIPWHKKARNWVALGLGTLGFGWLGTRSTGPAQPVAPQAQVRPAVPRQQPESPRRQAPQFGQTFEAPATSAEPVRPTISYPAGSALDKAQKSEYAARLEKAFKGTNASKPFRENLIDISHFAYGTEIVPEDAAKILQFCAKHSLRPLDFFWAAEHATARTPAAVKVHSFLSGPGQKRLADTIRRTSGSAAKIDSLLQGEQYERDLQRYIDAHGGNLPADPE